MEYMSLLGYLKRTAGSVLLATPLLLGVHTAAADKQNDKAAATQDNKGWIRLFDGSHTKHWRGFGDEDFPDNGWVVQDGWLKHRAEGGGGDIITKEKFGEFDLRFEWRAAYRANSGVKYFIKEDRGTIGHEYQILDAGSKKDPKPSEGSTAGFYDVFAPTKLPIKPAGFVNSSRILVKGKKVQHWLNDTKVLEYKLGSEKTLQAVQDSKFDDVEGFGKKDVGHILLQDHGDEVWYRNIRIRRLD